MADKKIELKPSHRYRTNPDFILRKISGEAVLVPTGDSVFGNSMISVNETFTYLWELFSENTVDKLETECYNDLNQTEIVLKWRYN